MNDAPEKKTTNDAGAVLPPTVLEIIAEEEAQERKWFRISLVAAVMVHVILFWIHWPSFAGTGRDAERQETKIYVMKQVKFKPPKRPEMENIPKPQTKKVPIPDPTPDQPEPIRDEEPEEDIDFVPDEDLVMGVPDAPPAPEPEGPVRYVPGGDVTKPEKITAPAPVYPEAARRARIEGAVILELIIDKQGNPRDMKVLKGLPLGCTKAAQDAVEKWRFKPSTLNGKPVEVMYVLTVRFSLS